MSNEREYLKKRKSVIVELNGVLATTYSKSGPYYKNILGTLVYQINNDMYEVYMIDSDQSGQLYQWRINSHKLFPNPSKTKN
jgi:hypothetical protein